MAKILVIRFSALGDVAMTIPVISSFATQYPQHEITVLSRKFMAPLFTGLPSNVNFRGVDFKESYKGFRGLNKLYKELKIEKFEVIIDLHNVLRSIYLRLRFFLDGCTTTYIDKQRKEKRALTRTKKKILKKLPSSFDRYANTFKKVGYPIKLDFVSIYKNSIADINSIKSITGLKGTEKWIGIAPFAAHKGKIYPLNKQEEVIKVLATNTNNKIFLFGGGKQEKEILEKWESKYLNVVSMAGKLLLSEELILMEQLDVMISMDSGNMHLASLVNTPVISVWGATHPYAGFMGWHQSEDNAVQIELPCRPCSVFGNKPCMRRDYACLNNISTEMIINKINSIIK